MGVKISLGKFISTRRKQKFMTQEELANKMHAIAKWETDGGVPDRDNLYRLAEIIGVSVDAMHHIMAGNASFEEKEIAPPNITQDVIQLLEAYGYEVIRPEEKDDRNRWKKENNCGFIFGYVDWLNNVNNNFVCAFCICYR